MNINTLDPALSDCMVLSEGTAAVAGTGLDFAFTCPYWAAGRIPIKIILLRSGDHASSFHYVSTLLAPRDASFIPGAAFFNAPTLLPQGGGAPLLLVTPDNGHTLCKGCVAIPFADENTGTLVRGAKGLPTPTLTIPAPAHHFGGAWDRGATGTGILMDDLNLPPAPPFRILNTKKAL